MKYAIIVPFNYKEVKFDTIRSKSDNAKPFLYYQLDLLINKLDFDRVLIIHNHENVSEIVSEEFAGKYKFIHPLDMEYSEDQEETYYLRSLAVAISRVPDSTRELYIIGDNILIDPIVNIELMMYNDNSNKNKLITFMNSSFSRGLYNIKFDSSVLENGVDTILPPCNDVGKAKLLPAFIIKSSALEFLKLNFSDNYGTRLLENISDLSKNNDFRAYSIESDDFREFYNFDEFIKFRSEMEDVNNVE